MADPMRDNWAFTDWKCHIACRHWADNAIIVISQHDQINHKIKYLTKTGEVKEIHETQSVPEGDILVVPFPLLQALCDELSRNGFKPSDRRFREEIELKDAHLKDMRDLLLRIVDKLPGGNNGPRDDSD